MKAEEISLAKFIGEKARFVIPVYQRNYDWKKSNCERLFDDVTNIIATGKPHFLGTIVYQSIDKGYFSEYIIIDGQQRIASVILLARALCEVIDDSRKRKNIFATFIKHSDGDLENQLRLKPSEYDAKVFQKLMNNENFSESEKFSSLYTNYFFFMQKLSHSKIDAEKIYDALSKLKVVKICLDKDENPQEIFESLNSTGLDLSNVDLIRNYLLMALDYSSQEILYKNYWLQVELLLKSSNAVENFMVQYLITKRRSDSISDEKKSRLSKNNLYYSFKKFFDNEYNSNVKSESVENFLKDLYYYAKIYRKFIFDETATFNELSPLEKKFYELTFRLEATNAPIILMYLYDRYNRKNIDETTFIKFVDALISLAFRARVCDSVGISSQFAGNVIARFDKAEILTEEIFWDALTFGKGDYAFPRDEEFKTALTNENLYTRLKNYGCKYLLYALEKFTSENPLPAYSIAAVEHIIPQRLNDKWRGYLREQNDLQTYEYFVHTLGNLILTADAEKSEGAEFDAKKFRFAASNFIYTKDIATYTKMNSKQIQARAKKLANVAVQIWTLPQKYNEKIKPLENVYTLDYDFGFFTGKKPATISILNVEKNVTTWKALAVEIFKQLNSLDADNFRAAMRADNVARNFSANPNNFYRPREISEGIFVETDKSVISFLRLLKAFVTNFDEMSGTNIKDEIWFTLK